METALRGGEPAATLAAECSARREAADAALAVTLARAPTAIADARATEAVLAAEEAALNDDLAALSKSLDALMEDSEQLSARALLDGEKAAALDELADVLAPMCIVAEAITLAEASGQKDVTELHETVLALENATRVASEGDTPALRELLPELQDHVAETTAMMEFRFLDLLRVSEGSVSARSRSRIVPGRSPADALSKAGLLSEAMRAIVEQLKKAQVAEGIRASPVFFSAAASASPAAAGPSVEWSRDGSPDGELLEFDFDDLDDVPESEVDAMSAALDISNAAARAIAIFDLIRDYVVGDTHSAELAEAIHPWIVKEVLPVSAVLTSLRPQMKEDGVPTEALRSRVLALGSSARVLQAAMRSRGADASTFVIDIDTAAMEKSVASECRGMAVLSARRAIGSFADARHDSSRMVPCPVSAQEYVAPADRETDYFPPCIVSQSATAVLDVFLRTRGDAQQALSSGSPTIGNALLAAAYECVDAYRVDIPFQHSDEMRRSLLLKALYYNDCMMLKHACVRADDMDREQGGKDSRPEESSAGFRSVTAGLTKAGNDVMMSLRRTAEKGLTDNLASACRGGALGAYGTLTRIQRGSALNAAYNAIRELVEVFAKVIPVDIAEMAAAALCQKYLQTLCGAVASLDEILPNGCDQIEGILKDAVSKTESLMKLVSGFAAQRGEAAEPAIVKKLASAQARANAYQHIVSARMEDIVSKFRAGEYGSEISRDEIEMFLLKIFEDSPLRASFIKELDVSTEAEAEEWGDQEW